MRTVFVKFNYLPTNKRKVPRYHRAMPAVKAKIRRHSITNRGIRIKELRGAIGATVVFATSADLVERYPADTYKSIRLGTGGDPAP